MSEVWGTHTTDALSDHCAVTGLVAVALAYPYRPSGHIWLIVTPVNPVTCEETPTAVRPRGQAIFSVVSALLVLGEPALTSTGTWSAAAAYATCSAPALSAAATATAST